MPGIVLMDFTHSDDYITDETRNAIIKMVHDVIEDFTGLRSKHTTFRYRPAGHLEAGFRHCKTCQKLLSGSK